ncbi:MAG: hypothetical protein R2695_20640 [Acidimicrobiales bacterium]
MLTELNGSESALNRTLAARERLDARQRELAEEIEAAAAHLRVVAVRAFVSGGRWATWSTS